MKRWDQLGRKPGFQHVTRRSCIKSCVRVIGVVMHGQENNLPLSATASFIIFPWKIAAGVILIIAIAVVIYLLAKRNKGKKKTDETSQPTPQTLQ